MNTKREFLHKLILPMWLVAVVVLLIASGGSLSAAPTTFTVTNTNDSGAGSLRQAITDANANGNPSDMDVIEFDIPGSGVQTIEVSSQLPNISQKVTIDGYSQAGAQINTAPSPQPLNSTIKIEIKGNTDILPGLILEAGSSESVISGLSIHSFNKQAIRILSDDVKVYGNYLNVKADGISVGDNGDDNTEIGVVALTDDGGGSGIQIGSSSPADRNVITGIAGGDGAISGNGTLAIYGNYIGLGKDGITDLECVLGVNIGGNGSTLGGTAAGQRNVISGCSTSNVILVGNNNTVQGNYIGTDYTGSINSSLSNGIGVVVNGGASENLIGGTSNGEGNIIRGVAGSGVGVQRFIIPAYAVDLSPSKNAILGNRIGNIGILDYPGIGTSNQGIDFFAGTDRDDTPDFVLDEFELRGVTPNDNGDGDTGPNGLINFPVLKTAQQSGNQIEITYDLDAADSPTDRYRVEFFASDERSIFGYGPGQNYLGAATNVEPGENRTVTLNVSGDFGGKALSATTTAVDDTTSTGFGATSEFAQNISIGTSEDFDADGIADTVEDGAPNNGDGNNDGTPDRLQPTVTSYVAAEENGSSIYTTLMTEGCSENGTVSSLNASSLQAKDNGYTYPYGLADYTLYCSRGDSVDVTMLVHTNSEPEKYLPRKYNPNENLFYDIPGSNLTSETVGESTALKLTYSAQDGGDLDDDGEENGIIVDPVGLATEESGVLANTGTLLIGLIPTGLLLIFGAVYTYIDYRKHKKPLREADPFIASTYTYWHHLKVVAIPMAKYRVQVSLEKKQELSHVS